MQRNTVALFNKTFYTITYLREKTEYKIYPQGIFVLTFQGHADIICIPFMPKMICIISRKKLYDKEEQQGKYNTFIDINWKEKRYEV